MTPTAQDIGKLVQIARDFSRSRYKSRGRLLAIHGDKATVKVFKHKGVETYPLSRLSLWVSKNSVRR